MKKKFIVMVIQYKDKDEGIIEKLVKDITKPINTKYGKVRFVYQGQEERIISALEKVLKLAE